LHNLLLLCIYEVLIKLKNRLELQKPDIDIDNKGYNFSLNDLYADILNSITNFFNQLDTSIRKEIQKKGITVTHNIQIAFDTEFVNKDMKTNKLLSIQLAINTQSYLQLHLIKPYEFSSVDPLTNESYDLTIRGTKNFDYLKIRSSIRDLVNSIRLLKYPSLDENMELIINGLKETACLEHFEKDNSIYFRFHSTQILQVFIFVDESGYSLSNLTHLTNSVTNNYV
jgi:hypothetical protein